MQAFPKVTTPALILDKAKCKTNIERMALKAERDGLSFRPHFKTHQSLEIGRWFKVFGVHKIAVSSLSMAHYFSKEWDDITVAFPTNILEIDTINNLAKAITLNLTIENLESILFLEKHLKHHVNVFLQIDVGYHRTGLNPEKTDKIDTILKQIRKNTLINFKGFLAHSGHSYQCTSKDCIEHVHAESLNVMRLLKEKYVKAYPNLINSLGDTPSCSVCETFSGIDELRPGNFIFYDLTQVYIGSNNFQDIAVAVACPIVAKHESRNEVVIYGGGVHLSKERLHDGELTVYGRLVEKTADGWGKVIPDTYIKSLSQEHGVISVPKSRLDKYQIGDYVLVLPVHSCMTVNLMSHYTTTEGKRISKM